MLEIEAGTIFENFKAIKEATGCVPYSGIAINKKNKHILLVSKVEDNIYHDHQEGPILFYRGAGQVGDQTVTRGSNKTLYNALKKINKYHVYLAIKDKNYIFKGEVILSKNYSDVLYERKPDKNGDERQVVIFPLEIKDNNYKMEFKLFNETLHNLNIDNVFLEEDKVHTNLPASGSYSSSNKVINRIAFEKQREQAKRIGDLSEQLVEKHEKAFLESIGRIDLAEQVKIIENDGEGFDVLSFMSNGDKKFIEVKGTTLGKFTPFFISENELQKAEVLENYRLYRVYHLSSKPKFTSYTLREFYEIFNMEPASYICKVRTKEDYENHQDS